MGWDHGLSCIDCKEVLINVARNNNLNRNADTLDLLEAFLNKHADHSLVYDADDNYPRVPRAKFANKKELLKHLSCKSTSERKKRETL